ncbi:MAG: IS110 family transposase [Thermodesulfovibrio sp.]|nr:IS110 family transposase [Thermodesulfovibrio sp.]
MKNFDYFIGIDVSKDSFVVSIKCKEFIKTNLSFSMDKYGFENFIYQTSHLKNSSICACEPTSIYHSNLVNFLKEKGYNISMVNPYKVKQFFKFVSNKPTKTDKIDSKILAQFIHSNFTSIDNTSDNKEKEQFKYLVREKEFISVQIAKIKSEIKRLLYLVFPEIVRMGNFFSSGIISILKIFPSANSIRNVSEEKFVSSVEKYLPKTGKKPDIKFIYKLACDSIAYPYPHFENILKMKIQYLQFLENQKYYINKLIDEMAEKIYKREIEILTSIPGIAKNSAIYFMSEIMDIKRFKNEKKLIGYCGIDPVIKQSGKYKGSMKMSKRGNAHVRRISFIMAECVRKHCPAFGNYYIKKINEGKSYREAIVATSNKLLRKIYTLLSENRLFI